MQFCAHSCDDSFHFQTNMESGSVFVKEESEDEVEEIYNFSLPSVCYKSDPLARYMHWLVIVLGIDQNFDLFI